MKLSAHTFIDRKKENKKISMITCYDYTSACIVNDSNVDCILVGDSAAMIMHGFPSTVHADIKMMSYHIQSVAKGAPNKFIIGDMPFLSYRKGLKATMDNVEVLMKAGSEALKLEGAEGHLTLIQHIVKSGVPVMGHLGLTPQSVHTLGGHKVQGKTDLSQKEILKQAKQLEDCGCFSIVLECVPSKLAEKIRNELSIPVIGIGAGLHVDGQVLVFHDLLGFNDHFKPKFLKTYFNTKAVFVDAINTYHNEVRHHQFPTEKESYQ